MACDQGKHSEEDAVKDFLREELNATMQHVIDATQYVAAANKKECADMNESIAIDPSNPFDDATIDHLLSRLKTPITAYPNYHRVNASVPKIGKRQTIVELGMLIFWTVSTKCFAVEIFYLLCETLSFH
jgi:hypothetical protein